MRRALTVFLLLILPLQLSWAVVAAHCQHEGAAQVAGHMGHHEHKHVQDADDAAGDVAKPATPEKTSTNDKAPCVDDDCAYCHLASLKTVGVPDVVLNVASGSTFLAQAAPRIDSHMGHRIDRPKWRAASSGALISVPLSPH